MRKNYYLAYGITLNKDYIASLCPNAYPVAIGYLQGWKLKFVGSLIGSILSIEKSETDKVPFVIYETYLEDEKALDGHEGLSLFSYIKYFRVQCKWLKTNHSRFIDAFTYIPFDKFTLTIPTSEYMYTYIDAINEFDLAEQPIVDAYNICRKKVHKELAIK